MDPIRIGIQWNGLSWSFGSPRGGSPCFRCQFLLEFDDVVEAFKQKPMMLGNMLALKYLFKNNMKLLNIPKTKRCHKKNVLNYGKSRPLYIHYFLLIKKTTPKNTRIKKPPKLLRSTPKPPPTVSSSGIVEDEVLAVRGCLKPSRQTVICSEKPTRKTRKPEKSFGNSKIES